VHLAGGMSLAMFVLIPLLIRELGGTELTIGLVLGVSTAASVATRPLVGMLLDRVGRRPVLLCAGMANVVSWLPFLGLRTAVPWLYLWATVHAIVWGALFAAHFLWYAPRVLRSLRRDWGAARRHAVPGSGWRAAVVAAALGGGVALALSLLPLISGWHGRHGPF